ncbi:ATP-grasp domain-containing protein [Halalkalibacillus halophilus]|uniref:ATP-grasp domain-containing protein n=1 Tax=Halalkalibacillus halophilus TaxID=392827 RepID=UPI0012EC83D0|nr:ATP-grasp domain-containing protein [Halalkalibacillus halophilus]
MSNQHEWIPNLAESVPIAARKNQTSLYLIALEGYRRGLQLTFYSQFIREQLHLRYSLSNGDKTHHFQGSCGDHVTPEAMEICEDKSWTYQHLEKANVPYPKGKYFTKDHPDQSIIDFAEQMNAPYVFKPADGQGGKGVMVNIKTIAQLKKEIDYVRNTLKYSNVILEEYVPGEEVRIFVLENQVLAAANRQPASVIGDGVHTIKTLIEQKNEFRKSIPHLYFRPIKFDRDLKDYLTELDLTLHSIPKADERVFLRKISNVSRGGDPIDITDQLTDRQKQIAIQAVQSVPGLPHCGVDMILEGDSGKVIELNTKPGIGSHVFPVEGKNRNIPKHIIDYYFPETANENIRAHATEYFDFNHIQESVRERTTETIVIPAYQKLLYQETIHLAGHTDLQEMYNWLKKKVISMNIHGTIEKINENEYKLLLASSSNKEIEYVKQLIKDSNKYKVSVKDEVSTNNPVMLGFHLIDEVESLTNQELIKELEQVEKQVNVTDKEINRLNKRIKLTENSFSWKVTNIFRKVLKVK